SGSKFDEVTRYVASAGDSMERFASNEVLGDLSFELDALGAVLSRGFHPLKADSPGQFPTCKPSTVGRIPGRGRDWLVRSWRDFAAAANEVTCRTFPAGKIHQHAGR